MCSQKLKEKHTPLQWEELVGLNRVQLRRKLLARMASSVAGRKRFWDKVKIGHPNKCWEWQRSFYRNGYGVYCIGILKDGKTITGKGFLTHRLAYFLHHGDWPKLCVLHRCDNTKCCNPKHLFLGTQIENLNDMIRKGRKAVGERVNLAKLKTVEVVEIRQLYKRGITQQILATSYKTSRTNISHIVNRASWKHVK